MRISDWSSDVCSSDLRHELVPVNWKVDQILVEPLDPMYYVWFPETCVVSLSVALEQGVTCEAGIIGSDGVVGYEAFLGNDLALSRHVVQVAGRAQIGRAHV